MQRRRHERMEGSLFLLLCVATPYWIGRLGRLQCVRHSFVGLSGWIATEGLVMMGQVRSLAWRSWAVGGFAARLYCLKCGWSRRGGVC